MPKDPNRGFLLICANVLAAWKVRSCQFSPVFRDVAGQLASGHSAQFFVRVLQFSALWTE